MKGAENYFADSKELTECATRIANRELSDCGRKNFPEPKPNATAKSMDTMFSRETHKLLIYKEKKKH